MTTITHNQLFRWQITFSCRSSTHLFFRETQIQGLCPLVTLSFSSPMASIPVIPTLAIDNEAAESKTRSQTSFLMLVIA